MDAQTYANHRYRPVMWLITALAAVIAWVLLFLFMLRQPALVTYGLVLLASVAVALVLLVRRYAVRLQDRIIRLEMQVRLARLGIDADAARLTVRQLVALRFASDAELPALVQRTLAEDLAPDQIKRAVTAWQPDRLRT
jgi:hypothetical protein